MKSGIYIIKNIVNNKIYIGSAINIKERWWRHKKDLRKGKHHSKLLLRAWNKYGEQNFKFEILQEVSNPEHLLSYEQVYLDYYKSYENDRGYNICKTAGSQLGLLRNEETKLKISNATSGKNNPFSGRKHKQETIEYLRKISTGKRMSEETKQKLREKLSGVNAPNYGKKFSEETKRKIGEASSKRTHTEETKKKMGDKRRGRKHNQETIDKMRKYHSDKPPGKGYTFDKDKNKYRVKIWIDGVKKHIGYFKTEEEAIQAVLVNSDKSLNKTEGACHTVADAVDYKNRSGI